jgi:hypothetical protein
VQFEPVPEPVEAPEPAPVPAVAPAPVLAEELVEEPAPQLVEERAHEPVEEPEPEPRMTSIEDLRGPIVVTPNYREQFAAMPRGVDLDEVVIRARTPSVPNSPSCEILGVIPAFRAVVIEPLP